MTENTVHTVASLQEGGVFLRLERKKRLRRWEAALLLALAGWMLLSCRAGYQETELASKVLRLHVLANSDSEADQRRKLQVRDAVLKEAEGYLSGCASVPEARGRLTSHLQDLADTGAEALALAGSRDPVTVSLERAWFPTKGYRDVSLPAGEYQALRVKIGRAEGHNWWCVLFPPLTADAVTERSEVTLKEGLDREDVALITGADETYVLRFKCLEWFGALRKRFH